MKSVKAAFVLLLALTVAVSAYAGIKNKKFTKQEIRKMADTTAIIETKFGDIELRFFPEVAPNHVKEKGGTKNDLPYPKNTHLRAHARLSTASIP